MVFYNDKHCSIFLYSMERDYCQHESINVEWKIVKFLLKNTPFDNIAFEDVCVLHAADKKTPACWSVLSGKVLPVRGKRCIRQVIVSGGCNWDRHRRRVASLPRKHLLAGSFIASTACLRPRRSNRPSPTTLGSGELELCRTWYGIRVVVHAAIHDCSCGTLPWGTDVGGADHSWPIEMGWLSLRDS